MTSPIFGGPVTFTQGSVTINITNPIDVAALAATITGAITDRLDQLGAQMTAAFTTVDEALAALDAKADALAAAEAADRAAFDALAAVVRAFLAALPPAGGTLTQEQSDAAAAIVAKLDAVQASDAAETADETALQGEIPV